MLRYSFIPSVLKPISLSFPPVWPLGTEIPGTSHRNISPKDRRTAGIWFAVRELSFAFSNLIEVPYQQPRNL